MQETDSEIKRERDRRDLAEELNGGNTGKMRRFLPDHLSPQALEEKRRKDYDDLAFLVALKAAKPYEILFQETMDVLVRYEKLTEQAMTERDNILTEQQAALEQRLLTAGRLSDGTMVFKDKHGDVRRADETLVEDQAEIDGIIWHEDSITFEEFQERNQAIADTERQIDDIRRYQTDVLGNARLRMTDKDDKVTVEEMEDIKLTIERSAAALSLQHISVSEQQQTHNIQVAPEYNRNVPIL